MNAPTPTQQALYQARYGSPEVAVPAAGSPIIDHLLAHRSVRAYLPDPVSDDQLAAIVAAAQSAASSSNLHAWSVVAVRDPERKARLSMYAGDQPHIRQAPLFLVWLADHSPEAYAFELVAGSLVCNVKGHKKSSAELDQLCQASAAVARRLSEEADEVLKLPQPPG